MLFRSTCVCVCVRAVVRVVVCTCVGLTVHEVALLEVLVLLVHLDRAVSLDVVVQVPAHVLVRHGEHQSVQVVS